MDGSWGSLCDDTFGMAEANLVCKQMGFHLGAKEVNIDLKLLEGVKFEQFKVNFFVFHVVKVVKGAGRDRGVPIASLKCSGSETCLRECHLDQQTRCRPEQAVAVICRLAVQCA